MQLCLKFLPNLIGSWITTKQIRHTHSISAQFDAMIMFVRQRAKLVTNDTMALRELLDVATEEKIVML